MGNVHVSVQGPEGEPLAEWVTDSEGEHHSLPVPTSISGRHLGNALSGTVYGDVHRERIRAHKKHDSNGDSMERKAFTDGAWLSVLVEEVGEVAKAMCDHRHHGRYADLTTFSEELRAELIQVAAMTMAWVDAIDNWDEEDEN